MCDQVDSIYQAIEYIEAHLQCEMTVGQIADAAGYSLFHFIRTFNRVVHHTPYDYLMRRRLSEAARALNGSDRRIIDVAQDFHFDSQESFARAFKRLFGVQPSQWRAGVMNDSVLLMPPKTLADLRFTQRDDFRFPMVDCLPQLVFQGVMMVYDANVDLCPSQRRHGLDELHRLTGRAASSCVVITSLANHVNEKTYVFTGVAACAGDEVVPPLVLQMQPAGNYVGMRIHGQDRALAMKYLYFTWLPRAGFIAERRYLVEYLEPLELPSAPEALYVRVADMPVKSAHTGQYT
jgi:AraC family transcriptional regulator